MVESCNSVPILDRLQTHLQDSAKDGYITAVVFCYLTGTLNLTKIVHYHWSRMGKQEIQVV